MACCAERSGKGRRWRVEKYPVLAETRTVGELTVFQEGQDTIFQFSGLQQEGLWSLWAVGAQGELRIGVPLQERAGLCISRRFSRRMTGQLGPLLRGELRPAGTKQAVWKICRLSAEVFHTPYLRHNLADRRLLLREGKGRREIAVPHEADRPFPLEAMFCFARSEWVEGQLCWVFAFDPEERPIF